MSYNNGFYTPYYKSKLPTYKPIILSNPPTYLTKNKKVTYKRLYFKKKRCNIIDVIRKRNK